MRRRESINMEDYGSSYEQSTDTRLGLILEVMLDIRDLLQSQEDRIESAAQAKWEHDH